MIRINTRKWKDIRQLAMLLMVSFVLTSCGDVDLQPACVDSNDLGNMLQKNADVNSTSSNWIDSKIEVVQGKQFSIRTVGNIQLCPVMLVQNVTYSPSATNANWQDSGIVITPGRRYEITVSGRYSLWGLDSVPADCTNAYNNSDYVRPDCWSYDGNGLFAYIGNSAPASNWFVGNAIQTPTANFFELYNRNNNTAGYTVASMQHGGRIFLRYRDGDGPNPQDSWGGQAYGWYGDNRGAYTINVKGYSSCPGTNGQYLQASIGNDGNTGTKIDLTQYANNNGLYSVAGAPQDSGAPATGKVWLKIIDDANPPAGRLGDGNYTAYNTATGAGSNSGAYRVTLTTVKPDDQNITTMLNKIIYPVRELLLGNPAINKVGLAETMYKTLTGNYAFVQGVRAVMALSVVLLAFMYMAGLTNVTHKELAYLSIKMGIIIALIGPNSWNFFNTYLFTFFINGTDQLITILSGTINALISGNPTSTAAGAVQADGVFNFMNTTFTILLSKETHIKLIALLTTFPLGFFLSMLMYIGIFFFLYALAKALFIYLGAIIMISLMLFVAPIFISFILFKQTRSMFDNWAKQITSFAIQPVLLFIVLALFNVLIIQSLYSILDFAACAGCLVEMDLPISEAFEWAGVQDFDKFCLIRSYIPWGIDSSQGIATTLAKTPAGLMFILIFIILADILRVLMDWIVNFSNSLMSSGSGTAQVGLNVGANAAMSEAGKITKTAATAGIDTAKFAVRNVADAADEAMYRTTGTSIADSMKKAARTAVGSGMLSKLMKTEDKAGSKVYSDAFMTRDEKAGHDAEMKKFDSMSDAEKKAYKQMKQDERDDDAINLDNYREELERKFENHPEFAGTKNFVKRNAKVNEMVQARKYAMNEQKYKDLAKTGAKKNAAFGNRDDKLSKQADAEIDKKFDSNALKSYNKNMNDEGTEAQRKAGIAARKGIRTGVANQKLKAEHDAKAKGLNQLSSAERKKQADAIRRKESRGMLGKMADALLPGALADRVVAGEYRNDEGERIAKNKESKAEAEADLREQKEEKANRSRIVKTSDGRTYTTENGKVTGVKNTEEE